MELVPEKIDGAVVFNVVNACACNTPDCPNCGDYAVGLHNWLITTELRYVVMDFQDEKEVCPAFLEEVLQLWKRLKFPFLFTGVMSKPRSILQSYSYDKKFPLFVTPEEAIQSLRVQYPNLVEKPLEGIQFGTPIPITRPRLGGRGPEGEATDEEPAEVEE